MKIKNIDNNYSEKVTDRFIELSKQGQIFYNDDLRIFDLFQEKYKPMSISDYATLSGQWYKTIERRVKAKKLPCCVFGGDIYILTALIPEK